MSESPLRMLILSHGKSGSTGLYFKIKNSLTQIHGVFEPHSFAEVQAHLDGPLLVKVLLPTAEEFLPQLLQISSKRILLVRDPRDVLISTLLYTGGYEILWARSAPEIQAALALLAQKQREPRSLSLSALFEGMWGKGALEGLRHYTRRLSLRFCALAEDSRFFVCRYEDFIAGELAALEDYLGFSLHAEAVVGADYQRVVRTRGSGSWRDWFVPEDVETFKPVFREYMQRFGYDGEDWQPAASPHIEARHATDYVEKLIAERQQREQQPSARFDPLSWLPEKPV